MELPALKGAEATIGKGRPTIICEINQLFDRFGTSLKGLFAFLDSLEYKIYRLIKGELQPVEGPLETLADLGYSEDNNFWFLPAARRPETGER
jgi:hypothetical protein